LHCTFCFFFYISGAFSFALLIFPLLASSSCYIDYYSMVFKGSLGGGDMFESSSYLTISLFTGNSSSSYTISSLTWTSSSSTAGLCTCSCPIMFTLTVLSVAMGSVYSMMTVACISFWSSPRSVSVLEGSCYMMRRRLRPKEAPAECRLVK